MGEANRQALYALLARELEATRAEIETLAETLCADPAVYAGHAVAIQGFDRAAQIVAEVARVLSSGEEVAAILSSIRLDELRERLTKLCYRSDSEPPEDDHRN